MPIITGLTAKIPAQLSQLTLPVLIVVVVVISSIRLRSHDQCRGADHPSA